MVGAVKGVEYLATHSAMDDVEKAQEERPPSIKLPSGVRRYHKADLNRWIADLREGE